MPIGRAAALVTLQDAPAREDPHFDTNQLVIRRVGLSEVRRSLIARVCDVEQITFDYTYTSQIGGCVDPKSHVRCWCVKLVDSNVFRFTVLFWIFLSSVALVMTDETITNSSVSGVFDIIDYIATAFFIVEIGLKFTALGIVFHKHSYFRDPWNILDFSVVVARVVELFHGGAKLGTIRLIRFLRPLRSMRSLRSVAVVISALVECMTTMVDFFFVLVVFMWILALISVEIWKGSMHQRCFAFLSDPINGSNATKSVLIQNDTNHCSNSAVAGRSCTIETNGVFVSQYCGVDTDQFGGVYLNYDNVAHALLVIFKLVTLDEWHQDMLKAQQVSGWGAWIFFVIITFLGSQIFFNLVIAVLVAKVRTARDNTQIRPESMNIKHYGVCNIFLSSLMHGPLAVLFPHRRLLLGTGMKFEVKKKSKINDDTVNDDQFEIHSLVVDAVAEIRRDVIKGDDQKEQQHRVEASEVEKDKKKPTTATTEPDNTSDEQSEDNIPTDDDAIEPERRIRSVAAEQDTPSALCVRLKWHLQGLVKHFIFTAIMLFVTLVNVAALGIDHYGIDTTTETTVSIINLTCAWIFIIEATLKIAALQIEYLHDPYNILDLILVLLSIPEMATGAGAFTFSVFRTARVIRIVNRWSVLRVLLDAILHAFSGVLNLVLILMILILVAATFGVAAFGSGEGRLEGLRSNFHGIGNSALTIFIILTGDNWMAIATATMNKHGGASAFFFFVIFVIGNCIVINLMVALLIESFAIYNPAGISEEHNDDVDSDSISTSSNTSFDEHTASLLLDKNESGIGFSSSQINDYSHKISITLQKVHPLLSLYNDIEAFDGDRSADTGLYIDIATFPHKLKLLRDLEQISSILSSAVQDCLDNVDRNSEIESSDCDTLDTNTTTSLVRERRTMLSKQHELLLSAGIDLDVKIHLPEPEGGKTLKTQCIQRNSTIEIMLEEIPRRFSILRSSLRPSSGSMGNHHANLTIQTRGQVFTLNEVYITDCGSIALDVEQYLSPTFVDNDPPIQLPTDSLLQTLSWIRSVCDLGCIPHNINELQYTSLLANSRIKQYEVVTTKTKQLIAILAAARTHLESIDAEYNDNSSDLTEPKRVFVKTFGNTIPIYVKEWESEEVPKGRIRNALGLLDTVEVFFYKKIGDELDVPIALETITDGELFEAKIIHSQDNMDVTKAINHIPVLNLSSLTSTAQQSFENQPDMETIDSNSSNSQWNSHSDSTAYSQPDHINCDAYSQPDSQIGNMEANSSKSSDSNKSIRVVFFESNNQDSSSSSPSGISGDADSQYRMQARRSLKQWQREVLIRRQKHGSALLACVLSDRFGSTASELQVAADLRKLEQQKRTGLPVLHGKSLCFFEPLDPFRGTVYKIVEDYRFKHAVTALIALDCAINSLDCPATRESHDAEIGLLVADYIFTVLFAIEMMMYMIAYGVFPTNDLGQDAYFRCSWNRIDFFVVVSSATSLIWTDVEILRAFRSLRAIRLLLIVPTVRATVTALLMSLPQMMNILCFCVFVWFVFAVLGVQLLKGRLGMCDDLDVEYKNECVGTYETNITNAFGIANVTLERKWLLPPTGYDNVGDAMLSLWQIALGDGWSDQMYRAMDSSGIDHSVKPGENTSWPLAMFFLSFVVIGQLFISNLFIGVLFDQFHTVKERNQGFQLISNQQRSWIQAQKVLLRLPLVAEPKPPKNQSRQFCFQIVSHRYYEYFAISIVLVNLGFLSSSYYNMGDDHEKAVHVVSHIIVSYFTLEAILKIMATDPGTYLHDPWNRLDIATTIATWMCIFLFNKSSIAALRAVRCAKVIRLFSNAKGVELLFQTLIACLPGCLNVGTLLFVIFFVFGVFGVSAFGNVIKNEGINEYTNFDNLAYALVSLYQASTAEGWVSMMEGCSVQPPNCSPNNNNCGTHWAKLYFVLFMFLGSFITLNLFITILLESFIETSRGLILAEKLEGFNLFKSRWLRLDPDASRLLKASDGIKLLRSLPPPLWRSAIGIGNISPVVHTLNELGKMHIPLNIDREISYNDTLSSLVLKIFNLKIEDGFSVSDRVGSAIPVQYLRTEFALPHYYAAAIISDAYVSYSARRIKKSVSQQYITREKKLVATLNKTQQRHKSFVDKVKRHCDRTDFTKRSNEKYDNIESNNNNNVTEIHKRDPPIRKSRAISSKLEDTYKTNSDNEEDDCFSLNVTDLFTTDYDDSSVGGDQQHQSNNNYAGILRNSSPEFSDSVVSLSKVISPADDISWSSGSSPVHQSSQIDGTYRRRIVRDPFIISPYYQNTSVRSSVGIAHGAASVTSSRSIASRPVAAPALRRKPRKYPWNSADALQPPK